MLVSRPVIGPVFDGGPALLRELIPALPAEPCDYFGDPRRPLRPRGRGDGLLRVPRLPGGRGAEVLERAAIGAALIAREHRRQPVHLFFAPGPLTERVAAGVAATPEPLSRSVGLTLRAASGARSIFKVASSVLRGRKRAHERPSPVLQTLTCAAGLEGCAHMLEVLDGVVALSGHTRDRLIGSGVAAERVHQIYPGVDVSEAAAIENPARLHARRGIIYAGELDAGAADRLIELARTLSEPALRGWTLIIACRPDQIIEHEERSRLSRELAGAIGAGRVELRGEVDDMPALLRRCAIQLFVADEVHRRLDIPLVLLEGLREGLALVALDRAPIRELFTTADGRGREIGARVDPTVGPQGVVKAVHDLCEHPEAMIVISHDCVALVRDAFSAARMGADYAALHREVLRRY
jgi:glycosyltransferase involved in cell wall biosynthesis